MMSAYVGLGSNLADPEQQLDRALLALQQLPDSRFVACSPYYRSAPLGPQDQPDYINAVAALDTALPPETLLQALQAIETAQGRIRSVRWGARTLDLDLLLYGDYCCETPVLTLPHPRLAERNFVLVPLHDIAPTLILPDGRRLRESLDTCPSHPLEKLTR